MSAMTIFTSAPRKLETAFLQDEEKRFRTSMVECQDTNEQNIYVHRSISSVAPAPNYYLLTVNEYDSYNTYHPCQLRA